MNDAAKTPETILITGAGRGLGFAFTELYAQMDWKVIACCRKPENAQALQDLAKTYQNIEIYRLDVTDQSQIKTLGLQLTGKKIDVLLNNAGIYGASGLHLGGLSLPEWMEVLAVNCIAPILIAQEFLPNVLASSRRLMVFISSRMGSIKENTYGDAYYYRTSKTALNASVKSLAVDLKDSVTCVCVDPGWVRTDFGGGQAPLSAEESVNSLAKLFQTFEVHDSGKFYSRLGEEIAW